MLLLSLILENELNTSDTLFTEFRNKIFKMYFSHVRLYMARTQQEKNKRDSKDESIIIVDEEESIKPKEEILLEDEGIRDEIKEETRVVQDIEQGDEDIEEEDNS